MKVDSQAYLRILYEKINEEPLQDYDSPLTPHHLKYMLVRLMDNLETWSPDKIHRRIGFIHAGLIANKLATLDQLMHFTRHSKYLD